MSENMESSDYMKVQNTINMSSARRCSVISFYRNAYIGLAATSFELLTHINLFTGGFSGGGLVFVCILLLIVLYVGLVGMFTMGFRIDEINRLTESLVETIGRRSATSVQAVSILSEVLANYTNIPCSAFWRTEPFVLKGISS